MAETKHRTTLEIGVEDREVIGLGREIDNTFDPRRVEAFAEAIERAASHMSALADAQERVANALDAATQLANSVSTVLVKMMAPASRRFLTSVAS